LVKLLPFGKVRTNPEINDAFGKVVSFGKVIDKDLVTADSFGKVDHGYETVESFGIVDSDLVAADALGKVDHGYETVESFGIVDSDLVIAESFGNVDHGYETVESFGKVDSDLVEMLPIGYNDIDYNAIRNILSVLARNVGTHKVNQKTMLYYAHDNVSPGEKIIMSKICEDQRNHHYKLLFAKLANFEVDFHCLLSMITCTLTRTQQNSFGEILNMVNRIFVKKEIYPLTSIPSNYDHLRRL
jgi:hypothetical protein